MAKQLTLTAVRDQIAALQQERSALERQQMSRQEAEAYIFGTVDEWQRDAERRLHLDLKALAAGEHPNLLRSPVLDGAYESASAAVGPVLALVLGDALKAALAKHIEVIPPGVSGAERRARIAEIAASLDDLEAREEALICEAESRGEVILRRADARPEIILGTHDPVQLVHKPLSLNPAGARPHFAPSTYVGSRRA